MLTFLLAYNPVVVYIQKYKAAPFCYSNKSSKHSIHTNHISHHLGSILALGAVVAGRAESPGLKSLDLVVEQRQILRKAEIAKTIENNCKKVSKDLKKADNSKN
jgi:hypothetical protein